MKTWITPKIISSSINSGGFTDGAEAIATCGGAVVPAAAASVLVASVACVSQNPAGSYSCTGIVTFGTPGMFYLTASAATGTIAQACS